VDASALEDLLRDESPRVLGALLRRFGHFEDAEDAVQEAMLAAWRTWPSSGLPDRPGAWLLTTARNRLLDKLARENRRALKESAAPAAIEAAASPLPGPAELGDDELRLIFLCCHPSLPRDAQVALTLRAVGGLTTEEIARAYLVPPATMAQRIVRAKRKVADVRFELPETLEDFASRVDAAQEVIYLIFTTGHSTTRGDAVVEVDLCREAIRLGRMLRSLVPSDSGPTGLLALMLLHDARRAGRSDAGGRLVPLADQDRSCWDAEQIAEGVALVESALTTGRIGRYPLQAAIAALHAEAPTAADTDWPQILALYRVLARIAPGPAVALNLAVPLAEVEGAAAGLRALDHLAASAAATVLGHRLPAARAHLLERLGCFDEAGRAYRTAIALSPSVAESRYLEQRVRQLPSETS
jgi:RNA polymerase sigma factor (sigma-70 family)